eukprot:scaffold21842_cov59-Attheya_sp.AAC.1
MEGTDDDDKQPMCSLGDHADNMQTQSDHKMHFRNATHSRQRGKKCTRGISVSSVHGNELMGIPGTPPSLLRYLH